MDCKMCDICGTIFSQKRNIVFFDGLNSVGSYDICKPCASKLINYLGKESHVKGQEKTVNRLIEMRGKMEVVKDETRIH